MRKPFMLLVTFVAICLLLLGALFLIAGGPSENYITGGLMLLIAFGLLGYIYAGARVEAKRPIQQEFHVTMGGSGEFKERKMTCKSCGGALQDKDLTVVKGGVMVKCPYCGFSYALEEEPKW